MASQFRNLVFEGGGVKGIAYVGALEVLEERGILSEIKRVGGTSAGAITAVLLALGYALDEIEGILRELNFRNFLDDMHLHSDDWQRTIYIDTLGVGTTDFDIDGGKKDALIASGREGTIRYFDDWFNNPAIAVVNRP